MASSWGTQITIPALTVGGDLSASQYHFVRAASTAGQILTQAASTNLPLGVLQDAPDASGEAAIVAALGITVVVAGTSLISYGDPLGPNSTGEAVTSVARVFGMALDAPSAAQDQIRMSLTGPVVKG
jgi:hypothetical protein